MPAPTTCGGWCAVAGCSTGPGESQYYVEPKRLARLGYLEARKEPGKTRERTVYTLTDKGLQALREWARTPVHFTPLKSELLVRLLIADLVGEEPTRQSIATLREDIADLSCDSPRPRRAAATLPHRRKYLLLVVRLPAPACSSCTSSSSTRSNASSARRRPTKDTLRPRHVVMLLAMSDRQLP